MNGPSVVVVGSLHTDLIASAPFMPVLGTSVIGTDFTFGPGGKAANQAGQVSKLGVSCALMARVGLDSMGNGNLAALVDAGVDTGLIIRDAEHATGSSTIFSISGEYASIIVPGAGLHFTLDEVHSARLTLAKSRFVIGQLEISHSVTEAVFLLARKGSAQTVLNPSPLTGPMIPKLAGLFSFTDVLVVNRVEAELISDCQISSPESAEQVASLLQTRYGFRYVAITIGPHGAVLASQDGAIRQGAFTVTVQDTVGAGDAFLGGLIAGWATGESDPRSLKMACACGALAATSAGAFSSLPDRQSVLRLLNAG